MNILHFSRTMGQGGAEKIVYQLCKDNKNDNLFIASTGGIYIESLVKQGVHHTIIPDIDNKNPIKMVKILILLNKIMKEENIDIIHTHHRMAAFYARLLQLTHKKVKHIYTAHNVFYGKKVLLRFALQKAFVVAVGNGVKNNLETEYGISSEKITLIYNAIDDEIDNSYINPTMKKLKNSNNIIVGSIGRLSAQKGMDIFLKAVSLIKNEFPTLSAVIVGDGELADKLVCLVKEIGIDDRTYFLGYQKNVLEIISQMDFVVLASRWEGLPLTPIEVYSQSKTIIATNISGNNEIVQQDNGLLFTMDNVEELAEKIKLLCSNIELRKQLECNAYKCFCEKYSYETFLEEYEQIYLKCR